MKRYFAGFIALGLLSGCEKEIDIGYRSVDELYVVEGRITPHGTSVLVTQTRDMEAVGESSPVRTLKVTISGDDGLHEELVCENDGYYRSANRTTGIQGVTYTLAVSAGTDEFHSRSTMQAPGSIGDVTFMYHPNVSKKYLFCSVPVKDTGGADNSYRVCLYKNGNRKYQELFTDRGHDGGEIPIVIPVRFSLDDSPGGDDDDDRKFRPGDLLTLELQTLDRPVYDYLYSLSLSGNLSFNPIDNFSSVSGKECLGYFSAYTADTFFTVFDPSIITGTPLP